MKSVCSSALTLVAVFGLCSYAEGAAQHGILMRRMDHHDAPAREVLGLERRAAGPAPAVGDPALAGAKPAGSDATVVGTPENKSIDSPPVSKPVDSDSDSDDEPSPEDLKRDELIDNSPAGRAARDLYDLMVDMGDTLESITSLGAKESDIISGIESVIKILPKGEQLRNDMLKDVKNKDGEIASALKNATDATQNIQKSLEDIKAKPSDVTVMKKNYDPLDENYRMLFEMSDGLAAEAFSTIAASLEKPKNSEPVAPGNGNTSGDSKAPSNDNDGEPKPDEPKNDTEAKPDGESEAPK